MKITRLRKAQSLSLLVLLTTTGLWANEVSPLNVTVSGKGPPLVFIPGLASDGAVWEGLVDHLEEAYTCHVLTLPGFAGVEPLDNVEQFLPKMKSAIGDYIETRELRHPVVIGHSLGGVLGMMLALDPTVGLKGLVIVDSLPFYPAAIYPQATEATGAYTVEQLRQQAAQQSPAQRAAQIRTMITSMITDTEKREMAFTWAMDSDPATVMEAMAGLQTTDLRDDVEQIKIPLLILGSWVGYAPYGQTLDSIAETFHRQYETVENYTLHISDKGLHFLMWDDPDWTRAHIEGFLLNLLAL